MKQVFVSYAREDRAVAADLAKRLPSLGCQVWMDVQLGGGQEWWPEVLRQIERCDVFLTVVSRPSLDSVACQRERQYAEDLHRPILPVAVEPFSEALPQDLATRQIVDFSRRGEEAAFALAGAIAALPPAPGLPPVMPQAPPAPLSYLTELLTQVSQEAPLTLEQQREIVDKVEPALRSTDSNERRGGLLVLQKLTARDNYASVQRRIDAFLDQARRSDPAMARSAASQPPKSAPAAGPATPPPSGDRSTDAGASVTGRDQRGPVGPNRTRTTPARNLPPSPGPTIPQPANGPAGRGGQDSGARMPGSWGPGSWRPGPQMPGSQMPGPVAPAPPYQQGPVGVKPSQPPAGGAGSAQPGPAAPKRRATPLPVLILAILGGIFLLFLVLMSL